MKLDLAFRTRARPDEVHNGDAVWTGERGAETVFAVFDGSGHGPEAHDASRIACKAMDAWDGTGSFESLASELHARLRGSRGVAALICVFDGVILRGFGVGNVELKRVKRSLPAVLTPGVLGVRLRRSVRVFEASLAVGDRLLAHSDGLRCHFDVDATYPGLSASALCDSLLRDHGREHDDATVLVADVLEDP